MIKEIKPENYNIVKYFVENDIGRNYFILLGLTSKKQVYDKIYGEFLGDELKAVLFKRKSKVLQFYSPGEFDLKGFVNLISTMDYRGLIGPKSYCDKFLDQGIFTYTDEGAYIAKLDSNHKLEAFRIQSKTKEIKVEDLDEIVELYKRVFKSFSPKEVMEEKLKSNRGRGIALIDDEKVISLSQTDFETKNGAIIVGVATDPEYRCKGLATESLKILSKDLLEEGKDIYLQYDNIGAGKIYERLGFKAIDQVMHYQK